LPEEVQKGANMLDEAAFEATFEVVPLTAFQGVGLGLLAVVIFAPIMGLCSYFDYRRNWSSRW
jgi:hypothetical protein